MFTNVISANPDQNQPAYVKNAGITKVSSRPRASTGKRLGRHLLDLAFIQAQNALTTPREIKVMSDDEGGEPVIPMQLLDQIKHQFRCAVVQIAGGLICYQYVW